MKNKKRYILMTIVKSKYDGFSRQYYKLFDSYIELQHHLSKFWKHNNFIIFEETNLTRDNSCYRRKCIIK